MPDKMDIPATALPLIEWIRSQVAGAGAKGVVYGLSGGLDSALVGALGKRRCGINVH
jgi:NAD+ synthase